jgi:Protein of unknown function (DUF763)
LARFRNCQSPSVTARLSIDEAKFRMTAAKPFQISRRSIGAALPFDSRARHGPREEQAAPLHSGYVLGGLADRMTRPGAVIAQAIVQDYSRDKFLARLAHPFWFQSFGPVYGDGLALHRHHHERGRRVQARTEAGASSVSMATIAP